MRTIGKLYATGGTSLAVTIDKDVSNAMGLKEGDYVQIDVEVVKQVKR